MSNPSPARDWFYAQPQQQVPAFTACEAVRAYRLAHTGQYIVELNIATPRGGEVIEIDQITDVHLNVIAVEDDGDEEVQGTKLCRLWNREGESILSIIRAMDVAQYADQTVLTGDTLDYLSQGAMRMTRRHILRRDPQVLMAVGRHDLTKQMQTGLPNRRSLEEREALLSELWPHDIYYHAADVGDRVICVALNNSQGRFLPCQCAPLQADMERARAQGRILLAFMHEPIATHDGRGDIETLWHMPGTSPLANFSGAGIIGAKPDEDEATRTVYELLTENADVVRGVFCGHMHSAFYTEIVASQPDASGQRQAARIPMWVAPGNAYCGHAGIVTRIFVK